MRTLEVAQIVACCHGFPCIKAKHIGLLEQGVGCCCRPILLHLLAHHVGWIVIVLATTRKSPVLLLPKALAILHVIIQRAPSKASCSLHLRCLRCLLRHLRACALLVLLLLLLLLRLQTLVILHEEVQSLLTKAPGVEGRCHGC